MYELAKSILNNRGNEIRSSERKNNENKENMPNETSILVAEEMNEAAAVNNMWETSSQNWEKFHFHIKLSAFWFSIKQHFVSKPNETEVSV